MRTPGKLNCWEARDCGRGPGEADPCPAAIDATSTGVNGGLCAGRICWTVPGTGCDGYRQGSYVEKLDECLACEFFHRVKTEQAQDFRLLKLGQGLSDAPDLHATIARIESFLSIHEELHAAFDLRKLLDQITAEVQRTLGAEASVVFLIEGDPPMLHGELLRQGERTQVDIPVDESTAVGSAAVRNQVITVRDPYRARPSTEVFTDELDRQCGVETRALLAAPIHGSDGRPIGVITAANSASGEFSADDHWFLGKYALQAGLAIEKARLLEDSTFVYRLASFGETLAGLSHSLKGITHGLRGITFIVRRAVAAGRLQDVEAACELLDRQVQRIVDLSVAVGAYEAERDGSVATGEVNEIVSDVVATLREEADARAVALELTLSDSAAGKAADRVEVYRILVNLLYHAFTACPASGGRIAIETAGAPEGAVSITVAHNGATTPLDEPTDQRHNGALGLPTAARLAHMLGGELEQPEGGVSRVVLPVTQ